MEHIVSDIWDPKKGSEFRVLNKFFKQIVPNNKKIIVHTLFRNNKTSINEFLNENKIKNIVAIKYYKMLLADKHFNHSNKFIFLIECFLLYLRIKINTKNKISFIKIGQVHWVYNFLALIILNIKIVLPISGFTFVKFNRINHLLYILKTNILVFFGRFLSFFLIFSRARFFAATNDDVRWINFLGISCKRYSEVQIIDQSLNSFPKNIFDIYWSGALIERKSIKTLLNIWSNVDKKFSLTIYGSGPLEKMVTNKIRLFNNIKHIKELNRSEFINKAMSHDLYIITSLREVNSVAFYEAVQMNKIIFTRSVGGIKDFKIPGVYFFNDENELLYLLKKYKANRHDFTFSNNTRNKYLDSLKVSEIEIIKKIWI